MFGRLILVSILVGVILSALGLDPFDIVRSIERLLQSIWNMGFDAVRWLWRYFLLGAVMVIPIWIIMRLVNAPRGKIGTLSSGQLSAVMVAASAPTMAASEPRLPRRTRGRQFRLDLGDEPDAAKDQRLNKAAAAWRRP